MSLLRNSQIAGLVVLLGHAASGAQSPAQYQKAASAALQSQLSREGKDCPGAHTTYDDNMCIGKVVEATHSDFDTFYRNLQLLLAVDSANANKLTQAQEQWLQYRKQTCDAIDELYRGGTIRPSAVMRCDIQITRSRMRDLDSIYYTVLHN
jgi:uncharacterized protein YecT (DUF1311 family)